MKEFIPIEQLIPEWVEAREVIEPLIPDRISFIQEAPGKATLDISWSIAMMIQGKAHDEKLVPILEECLKDLATMMKVYGVNKRIHNTCIGRPLDSELLKSLNNVLKNTEFLAIINGRPTFRSFIRHALGIQRSLLTWREP